MSPTTRWSVGAIALATSMASMASMLARAKPSAAPDLAAGRIASTGLTLKVGLRNAEVRVIQTPQGPFSRS